MIKKRKWEKEDGRKDGCQYVDEFLGRKSCCLDCPFDKCMLEEPAAIKVRIFKTERDQEILNLIKQGISQRETAKRLGIHTRTVQRAIARSNK